MDALNRRLSAGLSRRGFVGALAAALASPGLARAQAPARSTLFRNVRVFDGRSSTLRAGQSVLVEGNRIKAVAEGSPAAPDGARVIDGLSDIGRQNAAFAEKFFKDEGVAYLGGSLGGASGRRIQFWPTTGRARQRFMVDDRTVFEREAPARKPTPAPASEDVELF